MRIGVLVPARNERAVIARRIANLAREAWPEPGAPHRVLVVDDRSTDGTAEAARAAMDSLPLAERVRLEVLPNPRGAGKAQAIAAGIEALADVDLVVLTDADVVQRPGSLAALARAFAEEPALALASGAQEFVADLAVDGSCRGPGGTEPVPVPGAYDRLTARVRSLESRWGKLWSVHGQLLAWRRSDGLVPRVGIAADDLDLMLQARAAGGRVRLVPGARFLEPKLAAGPGKRDQELRRARAYFQIVRDPAARLTGGIADRVQSFAYRFGPAAAPELASAIALAVPATAWAAGGPLPGALGLLAVLAGGASPLGRKLVHLLDVMRRARRGDAAGATDDRWETART